MPVRKTKTKINQKRSKKKKGMLEEQNEEIEGPEKEEVQLFKRMKNPKRKRSNSLKNRNQEKVPKAKRRQRKQTHRVIGATKSKRKK